MKIYSVIAVTTVSLLITMTNVDSKLPKSKTIRKNTNVEWPELLF